MSALHLHAKCGSLKKEGFFELPASASVVELKEGVQKALSMDSLKDYTISIVPYLSNIIEPELSTRYAADGELETKSKPKTLAELGVLNHSTVLVWPNQSIRSKMRIKSSEDQESDDPFAGLTPSNVLRKLSGSKGKRKKKLQEFVDMHISKVVASPAWLELDEKTLSSILRSQHLNIAEAQLFEAVYEWGQGQSKVKKIKVEQALAKVLKFIRFPAMTSEDLATVVSPKSILPEAQVLALFTYLSYDEGKRGALPKELAMYNRQSRDGRPIPSWFKWGELFKSSRITIANDGKTVTATASRNMCVLGDQVLEKGTHEWRFRIDVMFTNSNSIVAGVAAVTTSNFNFNASSSLGQSGGIPGWAFSLKSKQIRSGGHSSVPNLRAKTFGSSLSPKAGDTVSVKLNLDKGTMEFSVNGKSNGIAFHNVKGPVRPALALYGNNSVTLL